MVIDDGLTWKPHIDFVYSKFIKFTSIFYKVRDELPLSCRLKLYHALASPHIIYGIEVYANTCRSYYEKLYTLNKK